MENSFTAGKYKKQYNYESFLPEILNKEFSWEDPEINILLEKANILLGRLDSFSDFIPDIDFFISMHVGKEAIESSKIEGTRTEFDDLFIGKDKDLSREERDDLGEVQNYIEALNHGIKSLDTLPLTFRLFGEIHKILLQGVRGEKKTPGEIRKSQNWIGGSSIADAFFIPPHVDDLSHLIKDLELFLHNDNLHIPELIKIALIHYQFETIHPYLDGNGRMGRLLITLYFIKKEILSRPVLYLSEFLERNRSSYYDALTQVRESDKIEHWIKFFLQGTIYTCNKSISTLEKILELKQDSEKKVYALGTRAETANKLLIHLFSQPVVSAGKVSQTLEVSPTTAISYIEKFIELDILEEVTGLKKNKIYAFEKYIQLFR